MRGVIPRVHSYGLATTGIYLFIAIGKRYRGAIFEMVMSPYGS